MRFTLLFSIFGILPKKLVTKFNYIKSTQIQFRAFSKNNIYLLNKPSQIKRLAFKNIKYLEIHGVDIEVKTKNHTQNTQTNLIQIEPDQTEYNLTRK